MNVIDESRNYRRIIVEQSIKEKNFFKLFTVGF